MKTLLIFLFAFISLASFSQEKSLKLDFDKTYMSTTNFFARDTIAVGQTPYNLQVYVDKQHPTTQSVRVKLKRIGSSSVSVQLRGSVFGDIWSNIGSAVTWAGTTADTTIVIHNATANRFRFLDLQMSRVAGKAEVEQFDMKVFIE